MTQPERTPGISYGKVPKFAPSLDCRAETAISTLNWGDQTLLLALPTPLFHMQQWNYRMLSIGRDLKRSSSPTLPHPWQRHLPAFQEEKKAASISSPLPSWWNQAPQHSHQGAALPAKALSRGHHLAKSKGNKALLSHMQVS